jgi:hypothetical protein
LANEILPRSCTHPRSSARPESRASRPAFCAHLSGPSRRDREDAELTREIQAVHDQSRGRCGAPRVHAELRRRGRRLAASGGRTGPDRRPCPDPCTTPAPNSARPPAATGSRRCDHWCAPTASRLDDPRSGAEYDVLPWAIARQPLRGTGGWSHCSVTSAPPGPTPAQPSPPSSAPSSWSPTSRPGSKARPNGAPNAQL